MIEHIQKKIALMGREYSPGNASRKGHLYSPLPFPEFKETPVQRKSVKARWEMIKPHLDGETALDIGCHTGYNCFQLERLGFQVTGVELHELTVEIAQDVAFYYGSTCHFIQGEVTPELIKKIGEVDVCLFFSTFQWVTQSRGFEYAKKVLETAKEYSKTLFFETSMGQEGKAKMPMLPNADSIAKMLSKYGEVQILGKVPSPGGIDRVIFKCS